MAGFEDSFVAFERETAADSDYEGNLAEHSELSGETHHKQVPIITSSIRSDSFSSFCCQIGSAISEGKESININNAQKTNEGSGSSYITYNICFNEQEVKRRYSEFESLRKSLSRLYPTVIMPPIPEKHSITDYATMQSKAKEDQVIIEKRKRMLQTFLNRIAKHPQLSNAHIFHRFLENGVSWNDVLHSPPLSTLPKNILQVSPANLPSQSSNNYSIPRSPTSTSPGIPSPMLPTPSASQILKNPDPRFVESEAFTTKFANHMSQNLEKTNRRILKRLSDLSNDYADLGAVYNGFSLNESGNLAHAIEKVGQAVDSSFMATGYLITALESEFSEPLQEYSQFAQMIKQVLRYRHMKHLQLELTEESLEKQRATLDGLKKSEEESKRLQAALNKEHEIPEEAASFQPRVSFESDDGILQTHEGSENARDEDHRQEGDAASMTSNNSSTNFKKHHKKRNSSKLFSVLGHTLNGLIDVDPEATRRNHIGKTTDSIIQLGEALETSKIDLQNISTSIQEDLDRFQRQKVCDLRDMLIAYAKIQVAWCQKNLSSWEEAKAEVQKIQV
ncbi:hypothetical protein G9A89_023717 [Geosiphon pyriformis]|nr:hypothetical protein G9A89_023717 [Geosiphon pyriformis]